MKFDYNELDDKMMELFLFEDMYFLNEDSPFSTVSFVYKDKTA